MSIFKQGMEQALIAAEDAFNNDEVPVGASLIDKNGTIVAIERNRVIEQNDVTAHAEMLVLKKGFELSGDIYLNGYTLCVTLEPCAMCAQAISYARIENLYFGAYDIKSGGVINGARIFNHSHFKPKFYDGIMEEKCSTLLKDFFKKKR